MNETGRSKLFILRILRQTRLQPLWQRLEHFSRIGQNFWATSIDHSGELAVLKLLSQHLSRATVFDVGANEGQYASAVLKHLRPKAIHSFEPSAIAFSRLRNLPGVFAHNLALGEVSGSAQLFTAEPGASIGSLLPLRHPIRPFTGENDETVGVTTLDEFCEANAIDRIDLLKIDVEGAELSVLRGARRLLKRRAIRFVQFEFGDGHIDARTYLRDFFDILQSFSFYRVIPSGLYPIEYSPEIETFAPVNYFAAAPGESVAP